MTTATRTPPDHGTLSRRKYHGCKCAKCCEAGRAYQRSRYRRQGYGTWKPFVDAEPVRQHLLNLNAKGISYARIAKAAGLHTATVTAFIYALGSTEPRKKRATPEIAAKILAVSAERVLSGIVDATGTRRRLQALAANGWPMKALGSHIGVHPATVNRLTLQPQVYSSTAQSVADAYEELRAQRPEDHGVALGLTVRSRNRAAAGGWPDPLWWEDMGHIDDPDFDPAAAEELTGRAAIKARRAEIAHLASYGIPEDEIAARLGMAHAYVHDLIRDMRKEAA